VVSRFLAVLMALGFLMGAAGTTTANEADVHVAGVIVDYGDGTVSYAWIPFTDDKLTGLDLLRKSGLPLLTIGFGGLGDGVCKIETTGCDVSACRKRLCQTADRTSPYWQYLRRGSDGLWKTQALGGSGSTVHNGDVDLWIWAPGDSQPTTPVLTLAEVAERAGVDRAVQSHPADATGPYVHTIGALRRQASSFSAQSTDYLLAAAILVALAGLGGGAIWRVRRPKP